MPLNASEKATRYQRRFWMAHTGAEPRFLVPYLAVLIGSNFAPGHMGPDRVGGRPVLDDLPDHEPRDPSPLPAVVPVVQRAAAAAATARTTSRRPPLPDKDRELV